MRWHGLIGFETMVEVDPGNGKATVWKPDIVTKHYYGTVESINKRYESGAKVNDDLNVNNRFSVVSDPFANQNFMNMKWIEWRGQKWKIGNVTVDHPRLTIDIGGIYHDENDA